MVTFDFWETLARDTHESLNRARSMRLAALADVLQRAGHPRPASAVEEAYERCGAEMAARLWTENRDCSITDQVRLFFRCVEAEFVVPPHLLEVAVTAYGEPALRWPPPLMSGAADVVRRLAEGGLRLGIVSNTGRTPGRVLRRVLAGYGLLRYFTAASYSDEVGVRKPAPEIFMATLSRLAATPEAALHVGDNPDADVRGARALGMLTAHLAADGRTPSPDADFVVGRLVDLLEILSRSG